MKKIERHLLSKCPGCGRRLFLGAIFSVMKRVEEEEIERVYGLSTDSLENSNAIYFGSVHREGLICPVCAAPVEERVEVEYSGKCELCDKAPDGRTWWWDSSRRCNLGLCAQCFESPAGQAWIDARS